MEMYFSMDMTKMSGSGMSKTGLFEEKKTPENEIGL